MKILGGTTIVKLVPIIVYSAAFMSLGFAASDEVKFSAEQRAALGKLCFIATVDPKVGEHNPRVLVESSSAGTTINGKYSPEQYLALRNRAVLSGHS
jgi:hypothetical protein